MTGRRWKYWDGSIKGHLWNKTSVKLYLFQGIGVFLIRVFLYPRSRLIGTAALAVGFVAVDFIVQVIRVRRLQRRKLQEVEGHPNQAPWPLLKRAGGRA